MKLGRGLEFPNSEKKSRKWYVMHYDACYLKICLNAPSRHCAWPKYKNTLTLVSVSVLYDVQIVSRGTAFQVSTSVGIILRGNLTTVLFTWSDNFKRLWFKELKQSKKIVQASLWKLLVMIWKVVLVLVIIPRKRLSSEILQAFSDRYFVIPAPNPLKS